MPDLRRFTGGEAHWVPKIGRVVQPGEVVDVPPRVGTTDLVWPETVWEPVDPPPGPAAAAAATTRKGRSGGV